MILDRQIPAHDYVIAGELTELNYFRFMVDNLGYIELGANDPIADLAERGLDWDRRFWDATEPPAWKLLAPFRNQL